MKNLSFLLSGALAYAVIIRRGYRAAQFGNALSTGPVSNDSFIREAVTTLELPETNSPQTGLLALWPGMATSDGDLIQGVAISDLTHTEYVCPKAYGKWCIVASTLEGVQEFGDAGFADPGRLVTFSYKYNDKTAKYDQHISVDGKVVSSLSTSSGKAQGWGTAVECQRAACGIAPAHKYINTTIVLDKADPDYGGTMGMTGATADIVTNDEGKTWTMDTISIDESHTYT